MKRNWIERGLLAALSVIHGVEAVAIDLISATVPWLASLVPAYMVYENSVTRLLFPPWLAFAAAFVTEAIGFASINTSLSFWRFNLERRKEDRAAPVWVAVGAGVFYLAVVLTVNVLLDVRPDAVVAAKFLLSLLGVDGATIIAVRALHARQIAEIEDEKFQRREARAKRRAVLVAAPTVLKPVAARVYNCTVEGCTETRDSPGKLANHVRWDHKRVKEIE